MGKNVGYVRVSTGGQNVGRQLVGVDLDKVFTDRCSGGSAERPALVEMLDWIREDDVVHVHSMDRLGSEDGRGGNKKNAPKDQIVGHSVSLIIF